MLVVGLESSRSGMALRSTQIHCFVGEIIHDPKSDPLMCLIAILNDWLLYSYTIVVFIRIILKREKPSSNPIPTVLR